MGFGPNLTIEAIAANENFCYFNAIFFISKSSIPILIISLFPRLPNSSAANFHTKESFVCGCATKEANNRPKDRDTFRQPPGPRLNDRTRYRPRYGRAVAAAEHFFVR